MKGFGCLDTFKNLFFRLKFIEVDKTVSVYFSKLWIGPKSICLITYFSMRDFFFLKPTQSRYFILFSVQGNLMTGNTTVSELTRTYSSFKEKNLCQFCKVARTTQGNLGILLLREHHFSCCCSNYITLFIAVQEKSDNEAMTLLCRIPILFWNSVKLGAHNQNEM